MVGSLFVFSNTTVGNKPAAMELPQGMVMSSVFSRKKLQTI